jgi:hypothetical protein
MADMKPDATTPDYDAMWQRWRLVRDLLGGTLAMRAAQTDWLPKEEKETHPDYLKRLNRSVLYGAFEDTVETLSGKPFIRPVVVSADDDLSEQMYALVENTDMTGQNITTFARQAFTSAVSYGLVHILVDYPRTRGDESMAEERTAGYRPWFVMIEAPDLLYWSVDYDQYGRPRLDKIRFREVRPIEDPDDPYRVENQAVIREYTRTDWRVYTETEKGEWTVLPGDEGTHTFPDGVPVVTYYTNRSGYMTATPPLEKLAWTNLAHWQSDSDQRNILRFARLGFVFGAGISNADLEAQEFVIAPNRFLHSENPDAKVGYVEHSGKAIESGQRDLERLEERMEVLGLQPLLRRVSQSTATGQAINEGRASCDLQAWVRDLEGALEAAFEMATKWNPQALGELPAGFSVDIFTEFVVLNNSSDLAGLLQARRERVISLPTTIDEIKRRGILSEALSTEDEVEAVESEGMPLDGIEPDDDPSE